MNKELSTSHSTLSTEELQALRERLGAFQKEDLGISPIQLLAMLVDGIMHFNFENADKEREAERAEKAAKTSITKHL